MQQIYSTCHSEIIDSVFSFEPYLSTPYKCVNEYLKRHKMTCEVVHVQAGQCTNLIKNAVWNAMSVDSKFAANKDDADH